VTTTVTEERSLRSQESRLRKEAQRQGLRIQKCRIRDQRVPAWGTYGIVDIQLNAMVAYAPWANGFGLSIDEVEAFLNDR
jgi:hypothetical protein